MMEFSKKTSLGSPLASANCLSRISFWWLNDLFKKGYDRRLEPEDMYEVLNEDSTEKLVENLESEWEKEIQNELHTGKSPSLGWAIIRMLKWDIIWIGFCGFALEAFQMTEAILLLFLVSYFNPDSSISKLHAYLYAAVLTLMVLLTIIIHQTYFFSSRRAGMQLRIAVTAAIYKKVLRLSHVTHDTVTTGHIMNLISTDAQRFDESMVLVHSLWIGPVQLVVTTYLLWRQLGPSCLVGIIMGLLIIPYQAWLGTVFAILRQKTAVLSDERCKLLNEIITGIRVIKMYTWEIPYTALINRIRSKEVSKIMRTSYIKAADRSLEFSSPSLMSFLMFTTYVVTGNTLSAASVFSSLALLNRLLLNMTKHFPFGVQKLNETKISVRRIQAFLELSELQYDRMTRLNPRSGDRGVIANSITATWEKSSTSATLDNISFEIGKGDLLIVVGLVGSGKSSLLMTLLGELPLSRGDIKIRGRIGYASQKAWIFSGTVRQNILFGQDYADSRYKKIVRACALERDIDLMPEGDLTFVGEKGLSLSGGQKARINLARAIYYNADIYLLDDPLSAVDTHVGTHLFDECITGLIKDCPKILVTHQLQFLRSATEILCLKKGKKSGNNGIRARLVVPEIANLESGRVLGIGKYTELASSGIDFASLITTKVEDDDADSAIDEDTGDTETLQLPQVQVEVKRSSFTKALYRRSFSSSSDIQQGIDVPAEQADPHRELEPEERPRGSIPVRLYTTLFSAGANCFVLTFMFVLFFAAQGAYTMADWWLAHWSDVDSRYAAQQSSSRNATSTIPSSDYDRHYFIAVYGGIVFVTFLISVIKSFLFFYVKVNASKIIHNRMFNAVLRAPVYFFDTNPAGRIINRFSKDIGFMDDLLPETFYEFINLAIFCLAVVIVNVTTIPWVLLGVLPLFIVFLFVRTYYLKTGRELKRLEATGRSPIFSHFSSTLEGLATIRSLSSQKLVTTELNTCQDHHTEAWFLFLATSRWLAYRLEILCFLFVAMAAFTPLFISEKRPIDAGVVGLALMYAILLSGTFQWCVRISTEVENQMTSVERVVDYCQLEPEGEWHVPCDDVPPAWPIHGLITAEKVSLQYHTTLPRVLRNMYFCIRPKEKVGIVGRTGAGKSSLLAALFRMAEPKGVIRIDGVNITDIGLHDLRIKMSVIPQDPVLFSGTLRHNLDPACEYSDCDLWIALQEVQLSDVVSELLGGLHTPVTESGSNFSVGQRQLICLARALLRRNAILVVDEATAHVDQRTDALIQQTIRKKFNDCTVLTIAHRLNTIVDSDRVMVIDNGRLVEFDEPFLLLLNPEGLFSKLVEQTGRANATKLVEMAQQAYEYQHRSNPMDDIPEHLRCNLRAFLPSTGCSALQIVSTM